MSDEMVEVEVLSYFFDGHRGKRAAQGETFEWPRALAEDYASRPDPLVRIVGDEPDLPKNFPSRHKLMDAGLETLSAVREAAESGSLQEIHGIGPATEEEITRALDDVQYSEEALA